ncbi:unnamed protein product [Meganyctiphanes norvegica]|uniref:Male-enhanced antigen 1 n=1 Tax=Meganyctiphanes norvegica TaxID=48144 RepID=A0AAV2R430_MEGNR
MSPVPEPMPSHRGGPPSGDEEGLSPPIGGIIVPPLSSSDEELDIQEYDGDNNPPGYQPLSQDPQDEDNIDYSSLSGLMAALNSNGPNVVNDSDDDDDDDDDSENENTEEQEGGNARSRISMTVDWNQLEASANHEETVRQETAEIWNTPTPVDISTRLSLDSERVEEIKIAMSSFSLPPTAIPAWAQGLSQEEWNKQVLTRIKGTGIKPDQEGER